MSRTVRLVQPVGRKPWKWFRERKLCSRLRNANLQADLVNYLQVLLANPNMPIIGYFQAIAYRLQDTAPLIVA